MQALGSHQNNPHSWVSRYSLSGQERLVWHTYNPAVLQNDQPRSLARSSGPGSSALGVRGPRVQLKICRQLTGGQGASPCPSLFLGISLPVVLWPYDLKAQWVVQAGLKVRQEDQPDLFG